MRRVAWMVLACTGLFVGSARGGDAPFAAGLSKQDLHGRRWSIFMPRDFDIAKEHSLLVALHEQDGNEAALARRFAFLTEQGYVVAAPFAKRGVWTWDDIEPIQKTVTDLVRRLNVGEGRLHALGYAYGGEFLPALALVDRPPFRTVCWVSAGFKGGTTSKRARKMSALILCGDSDSYAGLARATPKRLRGKLPTTELRMVPGLGTEFPEAEMPYYGWWLSVQEGRFEPGTTLAFAWNDDEAAARKTMADAGIGGFVYWYSADDAEDAHAKSFQNETMQDQLGRFYGGQLAAWKVDRASQPEAFAAAGLTATPAVVVHDAKGKITKVLAGKIKAKALAAALRSVATVKRPPKD